MAEEFSRTVQLQIPCNELVISIQNKRAEKHIVSSKAQILAEAVSLLADKEFAE